MATDHKRIKKMYKLKAGEYVKNGKLYGWTGKICEPCNGQGEDEYGTRCVYCAGTGDQHGLMLTQPFALPPDTK